MVIWNWKKKVKSDHLSNVESQLEIVLPSAYKDFYARCKKRVPKNLIGTDLRDQRLELDASARELLKENQLENFLKKDDFVFMMHQGYMFWYFNANGSENPTVYEFSEVDMVPKEISPLIDFLKQY